MKNGKCPTWFVVKWLSKHHGHYASTPRLPYEYRHACYSDNGSGAVIRGACEPRNDWTIFRSDGTPVRFKRKPKVEFNGVISLTTGDTFELWTRKVEPEKCEPERHGGLLSEQAIRMFLEEIENNEKTSRDGDGVRDASSVRARAGKRRRG